MLEGLSANRDKRWEMMLEGSIARVLIVVAVPMIISMLIDSFYNVVDAYFVSQLGRTAVGAVGINDSLSHFIRSVSMGFGVGASSYISRLMGAKREDEASGVGTTTLLSAMIALFLLSAVIFIFIKPLVMALGSTESTKQYSIDYARFILVAAPFTAGEVVLAQILRAEGSTRYSMIGMVSGCIINVLLDPIFIAVLNLEVAGAAIATSISKTVSFCILLLPFLQGKTMVELKWHFFTPKREIYREVARMGVPAFLRSSMLSVAGVITNNVAGSFSDSALAASSVAYRCTRLVSAAIMGFGQGFQPIAGYCWGAKRYRRVRGAFWTCSTMGAAAGVLLGTAMLIFAPSLVNVFAFSDADTLAIATLMIRSQCITMVFHIWVIVVNGLFMALGKGMIAGFIGLTRQMVCLIPCVFILSALNGVNGLAIAQAVADVLSVFVALPFVVKLMCEIGRLIEAE